nr:ciliary-associated calcium-binding coiled-coil protein 1 isoform X1 [Pelodiscus sinensis]|eukprot:XP_025043867.1 ciliary-associated calcium-binding coiled-coil protein 1 isoform X1 [Pelodiscus sinensis]
MQEAAPSHLQASALAGKVAVSPMRLCVLDTVGSHPLLSLPHASHLQDPGLAGSLPCLLASGLSASHCSPETSGYLISTNSQLSVSSTFYSICPPSSDLQVKMDKGRDVPQANGLHELPCSGDPGRVPGPDCGAAGEECH